MTIHYGRERRRFFRFIYPASSRPSLRFWDDWDTEYPVSEISEGSIVFLCDKPGEFIPGRQISAFVFFRRGKSDPVEGTIVKIRGNRVVVELTQKLSLQRVSEEEIILDMPQGTV